MSSRAQRYAHRGMFYGIRSYRRQKASRARSRAAGLFLRRAMGRAPGRRDRPDGERVVRGVQLGRVLEVSDDSWVVGVVGPGETMEANCTGQLPRS